MTLIVPGHTAGLEDPGRIEVEGQIHVSHSELKTYSRCPKQHEYKYIDRLVPVRRARPLYLGSWLHAALQTHYQEGDWRIGHEIYKKEWDGLFEEERLALRKKGRALSPPLPEVVDRIIRSYKWYYRSDGWTVKVAEQKFSVPTPLWINGRQVWIDGIVDLVVQDEEGLWWAIDHKSASMIPDATSFHAMDPQLVLYPWALKQQFGWDIAGVIYNYVKSRPPGIPQINKNGSLSRRKIVTDYPTAFRFLRDNGYDPNDFSELLRPLQRRSPFLRRYRLPRSDFVTREVLSDALAITKRIHEERRRYRFVTRECSTMCSYHDLCRAELNGLDTENMRKTQFTLKEKNGGSDSPDDEYTEDDEEPED